MAWEDKLNNVGSALTAVLNSQGIDNDLDTPDLILAGYMLDGLRAYAKLRGAMKRHGASGQTHQEIHVALHKSLDELAADFISHTKKLPRKTTMMEFMNWAYQQTLEPSGKLLTETDADGPQG